MHAAGRSGPSRDMLVVLPGSCLDHVLPTTATAGDCMFRPNKTTKRDVHPSMLPGTCVVQLLSTGPYGWNSQCC